MRLRTLAGWLGLAFVIWWVMTDTAQASHLVTSAGHFLNTTVAGVRRVLGQM